MLTLDADIWVAAFDVRDRFHERSVSFLRTVATADLRLHAPAFLAVEVGCALARRSGHTEIGSAAAARLSDHPALTLHALDAQLLAMAADLGARLRLRGADALYAATAELTRAPLISWDEELVVRAGGTTPEDWVRLGGEASRS